MSTRSEMFHPDDLVCNDARMKPSIDRARSPFDDHEDDSSSHGIVSKQDASSLVGLSLEEASRLLLSWVEKP